ncbi:N-acetylmuramoyl-L-alanine amidase [Streptomyces sp. NBC_00401]|uniref:N-acetylmuramoyl-L-alanine amidase n=1 Tax=Streptomyces sp. NBC_00401 TaxID=2975738 RepID=UPI0022523583|nr:N-acetylmuramoyl-L-alanine amidase [Streptomyces sp. NBC_00401]MCX5081415.1 N-acetylmuramoyl-L-alanine amidase [Streptomyces sp. NBC_00401]
MSYVGPDSDGFSDGDGDGPRRPRRFSGGPLTVTLAALVPTALAGWLIWQVVGGPGENEPAKTLPAASQSSTAGVDTTSPSPSKSDDGKKGAGSPSATPSKSKPPASSSKPAGSGPLKGKVVVIDPGHNPGNFRHTAEINRLVDIGTNRKECDTTGTSTNAGYTEAQFTLDVSRRLRTLLQQQGATVELTQNGDRSWGPCVDERARIGNKAHADAVISVHADGSAAGNRGFHVILPASVNSGSADTTAIAGPSRNLGERVAGNFLRATGSAPSNYIGDGTGLDVRKDLGGLNLSTVPKVFIECGNMRDAKDAALLTNGAWRQKAAQGMSDGIVSFLRG